MNLLPVNTVSISNKKTNFPQQVFPYLVYLYSLLLPFQTNFKNVGLILLVGFFLIDALLEKRFALPSITKTPYGFLLLYILICLGSILISSNQKSAVDYMVLQLTVPALPLLLHHKLSLTQRNAALKFFSLGTLCLSVYAFIDILRIFSNQQAVPIDSIKDIDWVYVSYNMPKNVDFHAPYYSLYIGICLLIHAYFLYTSFTKHNKNGILQHVLACLFYLAFQALLSSRTALFATLLVITLSAVYITLQAKKWKMVLIIFFSAAACSFIMYEKIPYLKMKMSQSAGQEQRRLMWQASFNIIQRNPVFGVGSGDRRVETTNAYREVGFTEGLQSYFNCHNQFLEWGVSFGLIGILTLTLTYVALCLWGFKQKKHLLFCFLAIFILCCLTESLLQRQAGVLLFSYMVALLGFSTKDKVATPTTNI